MHYFHTKEQDHIFNNNNSTIHKSKINKKKQLEQTNKNDEILKGTLNDKLESNASSALNTLEWYIDPAFLVHSDFKSYPGATLTFRHDTGIVVNMSAKQKLNTRCSTTVDMIGVDQVSPIAS